MKNALLLIFITFLPIILYSQYFGWNIYISEFLIKNKNGIAVKYNNKFYKSKYIIKPMYTENDTIFYKSYIKKYKLIKNIGIEKKFQIKNVKLFNNKIYMDIVFEDNEILSSIVQNDSIFQCLTINNVSNNMCTCDTTVVQKSIIVQRYESNSTLLESKNILTEKKSTDIIYNKIKINILDKFLFIKQYSKQVNKFNRFELKDGGNSTLYAAKLSLRSFRGN